MSRVRKRVIKDKPKRIKNGFDMDKEEKLSIVLTSVISSKLGIHINETDLTEKDIKSSWCIEKKIVEYDQQTGILRITDKGISWIQRMINNYLSSKVE